MLQAFCTYNTQSDIGLFTNINSKNIIDDLVQRIKDQVGNKHVLLGISGGVDSSVVAALISKAIGKKLHCIFYKVR